MVCCTLEEFSGKADGVWDNSAAFASALAHIAEAGGGTLSVSSGTWLTGPIELCDNCTLELAEGACIKFVADFTRYKPVWTRWEGVDCYAMQPCIQARNRTNVVITGQGTIDGGGDPWWDYRNAIKAQTDRGPQTELEKMFAGLNPDYLKQPGGGGGRGSQFLAPPTIQLYRCEDCRIEGITVVDSPFWTIHPVYCSRLEIRNVTVRNPYEAPNTDGLDIDSCRDVIVEDCFFDVGDDAIALKSGSGADGIRVGVPTRNVSIARCTVQRAHGGIVVGSETAAGIYHVSGTDCTFIDTDRGIRIKTRRGRGGHVEDLTFTGIRMENTLCPIAINMYYRCGVSPDEGDTPFSLHAIEIGEATPKIRRVTVRNLHATGSRASAGFFVGLPESPITDLHLVGCHIDTRTHEPVPTEDSEMYDGLPLAAGRGMRFRHCSGVRLEDVHVEGTDIPYHLEEGVDFS